MYVRFFISSVRICNYVKIVWNIVHVTKDIGYENNTNLERFNHDLRSNYGLMNMILDLYILLIQTKPMYMKNVKSNLKIKCLLASSNVGGNLYYIHHI